MHQLHSTDVVAPPGEAATRLTRLRASFDPADLQTLDEVYEDAVHALGQCGLDKPAIRELVAFRILKLARGGEDDPRKLLQAALHGLVAHYMKAPAHA